MTYILSLCFEFGLLMLEFELNGTLLNGGNSHFGP